MNINLKYGEDKHVEVGDLVGYIDKGVLKHVEVGDLVGYNDKGVLKYAFVLGKKGDVWSFCEFKNGSVLVFERGYKYMKIIRVIKNNFILEEY